MAQMMDKLGEEEPGPYPLWDHLKKFSRNELLHFLKSETKVYYKYYNIREEI